MGYPSGMSVKVKSVTCATSATSALVTAAEAKNISIDSPLEVVILNTAASSATSGANIGPSTITSAANGGFTLNGQASVSMTLTNPADAPIYAISAAGAPVLHVMLVGPVGS